MSISILLYSVGLTVLSITRAAKGSQSAGGVALLFWSILGKVRLVGPKTEVE
jgi:hypothetical protein